MPAPRVGYPPPQARSPCLRCSVIGLPPHGCATAGSRLRPVGTRGPPSQPVGRIDTIQQPACVADPVSDAIPCLFFDQRWQTTHRTHIAARIAGGTTGPDVPLLVECDLGICLCYDESCSRDDRLMDPCCGSNTGRSP